MLLVCLSASVAGHGGNTGPRRQQRKFHRKVKSKVTGRLHSRQMSWHSLSSEATLMALTSRALNRGKDALWSQVPSRPRYCVTTARCQAVSVHRKNIHCTAFVSRIIFLSRGYIVGGGTKLVKTTAGWGSTAHHWRARGTTVRHFVFGRDKDWQRYTSP